jgi:hypothetical protein
MEHIASAECFSFLSDLFDNKSAFLKNAGFYVDHYNLNYIYSCANNLVGIWTLFGTPKSLNNQRHIITRHHQIGSN